MTQFFLDCPGYVPTDKNPGLAKSYMKLMVEIWHKNRSALVVDEIRIPKRPLVLNVWLDRKLYCKIAGLNL